MENATNLLDTGSGFCYNKTKRHIRDKKAAEMGNYYEKENGALYRCRACGMHAADISDGLCAADDNEHYCIGRAGGLAELSEQGFVLVQQQ